MFFVRGLLSVALTGGNLFMTLFRGDRLGGPIERIQEIEEAEFFSKSEDLLTGIGMEIDCPSLQEALDFGRHVVDGFVDGFAVAASKLAVPKVGPLVLFCEASKTSGSWMHFSPVSWIKMYPGKIPEDAPVVHPTH